MGTITPQYNGTGPNAQASATHYYAVWRLRDVGERVLREYTEDATSGTPKWSWTHDYVYRGALLLAEAQPDAAPGSEKLWHYHLDHLGTPRLVTTDAGVKVSSHNFYPFGEEITDPAGETLQFTGHARDAAAGGTQYYMRARYDNVAWGRFLSVDPVIDKSNLMRPQGWNRYEYVQSNPLNLADPTGKWIEVCKAGDKKCAEAADRFEEQRQKDLKSSNARVRDAAAAWGDRGEKNNVFVAFVAQSQADRDLGGQQSGVVSGTKNHVGFVVAEFSEQLTGDNLGRAIAHEGSHVGDNMGFLNSYNPATGKYDAGLNFTEFAAEYRAFTAGNAVKPYAFLPQGSQFSRALDAYIRHAYSDPNALHFDPGNFDPCNGCFPQQ